MDDFGTLSLNDEQPPFGQVSLNAPDQVAAVPPEVAQPRALKAHFGLGDQSPGYDTLLNGIANGQEPQLRQDIARQYDSYLRLKKMGAVQEIAKQGALGDVYQAKALLAWDPKSDPDTIFEKTYAQKYVSSVAQNEQATTMAALAQDSEHAHSIMDKTQDTVTNQENFKKIQEEAENFSSKQFFGTPTIPMLGAKGVEDIAKSLMPFMSAVNMRNIVTETASLLPGNNLDEQITYLWSLPPEEAAAAFRGAVQKLQVINPSDAVIFAHAVNSYSNSERVMNNANTFVDATIIGGPLLKLVKLMKGGIVGNASKDLSVAKVLDATGDTEQAAQVKAVEIMTAKKQPTVVPVLDKGYDPLGQKLDLTSVLPSYSNPSTLAIGTNKGSLSREATSRIVGKLEEQNRLIENTLPELARVSRTTEGELKVGIQRAVEDLKDTANFHNVHDAILDYRTGVPAFEHLRAEDTRTNVDYVLMNLGKEGKAETLTNDLGFPLGPLAGDKTPIQAPSTPKLVVARKMEDGKIRYGRPGDIHADLIHDTDSFENAGITQIWESQMGFAKPGGKFMTRDEAAAWIKKHEPERFHTQFQSKGGIGLHASHYQEWAPWPTVVKGSPERVTSAAIKVNGKTYEAATHAEAYNKADALINDKSFDLATIESGFTTNHGRFISHAEATSLAIDNRQVYGRKAIKKSGANVYSGDFKEGQLKQPEFLTAKEANFGEVIVGKPDATLFKTHLEADRVAQRDYGLDYQQARIMEGPGNKWYISLVKSVDETDPAIRNLSIETRNTNPVSFANWAMGYARTPADQVAPYLRDNRLIATTTSTAIHKMIKTLAAPLRDLQNYPTGGKALGNAIFGKTSWQKMDDVLDYYKNFQDYSKEKSRGMWPTSMAQLQKDWKKVTGKLPNEREQTAFWTVVKLNDLDWTIRNYNLHRDLARQGIEHVSFPHPTETRTYTGPVWGKVLKNEEFPWSNTEDAIMAVYKDGNYQYLSKNHIKESMPEIKEWMNKPSVRVTQVAAPDAHPLKGVLDQNPHFVVSEDIKQNPLPVKLIDYNGGGHVIYPGQYYAKQPVVEQGLYGKFYHYGDQTLMNFETRAQADKYTPRVDQFRQYMKEGKTDTELANFVEKHLPEDLEYWKNKFQGKNAIFSLDHPFVITERGSTTFKTNPRLKEQYRDALGQDVVSYPESSYNLTTGIDKSFLQDRDGPLMSIKKTGMNPFSPVYKLETARTLKPLYAMERGVYNATRGLYLNDVKTASVEQWVKQFAPFLSDPIDKVQRNPYYQFYHGRLTGADKGNYQAVQAAENARTNLKNFLRTSTDLQGDLDIVNEKLMDGLYKTTGGSDKIQNWVATKDWNMIKHPIEFLRTASSNLVFGHYNPVQATVQTLGATHALVIDPKYGYQGAAAALLHNFHRLGEAHLPADVSEGVLKALDRMAILGGFRKGEFSNSVRAMERVGFDNVGREVSWRDSITDPGMFDNGYQRYLDKSYVFFNWGDRNNRMVAWHMAYKRFIDDNPTRVMDNRALGEVLNRADLLGANMTKESNSSIQKGIFSPALQFRTFQMRIAEQMMSDRLTPREKMQAFVGQSVFYGIPTAVSAYGLGAGYIRMPGGVENWYDDIRKYMISKGLMDISGTTNNYINLLHDGILDHMVTMATGTQYNVAKRFGPGVDKGISDLTQGITDVLATVGGPPGSTLEAFYRVALPFYAGIMTAGRGTSETYTVTHDEVLDVFKQVRSLNNLYNGAYAWNYQKYVSQNKQIVADDMSKTDAGMLMLLGLTRKDITDKRLGQAIAHEQTGAEETSSKRAGEEYRKMLQSMSEGDFVQGDKYLANAYVWMNVLGDVSQKKKDQIWQQAISEAPTLAQRVNQLLYDPSRMPPSTMTSRLKVHFGIKVNQ